MQNTKQTKIGLAPRVAAFHALMDWKKGLGFAQSNLQQRCEALPQNDRALAYEIALGTCRLLPSLDEKLKSLMRKLPEEPCRTILEISLYQLLNTRVPPYAVVNSAADLARKFASEKTVKFVNAVLRNALRKNFAKDESRISKAPPQWIRANPRKIAIEKLAAELGLQDARTLFGKYILVPSAGDALRNPLFEKGFYSFQNPASYFMAKMLDIKPGQRILDICAAPGGKTAMLAEENPDAFFLCADISEKRAAKLLNLRGRLGLENARIAIASAQRPPFAQAFDSVIADAPCSNMGVAERRPEAPLEISEEKIEALAQKQLEILQGASLCIKPGGIMVYCVCSQERQETDDVIEKFLKENPCFALEERLCAEGEGIDRFFIAKLRLC